MSAETTTVRVTREVRDRLDARAGSGQSLGDVVEQLLNDGEVVVEVTVGDLEVYDRLNQHQISG